MFNIKTKLAAFGVFTALLALLLTAVSIVWVLIDDNIARTRLELANDIETIKIELASNEKRFLSAARQTAELEELGLKVKHISRYKTNYNPSVTRPLYSALASAAYDSGKIAGDIWKTLIYDGQGDLVAFSHIEAHEAKKGYVHNFPDPKFMIAEGKTDADPLANAWQEAPGYPGFDAHFAPPLPAKEAMSFSRSGDTLTLKTFYPIMGFAFDPKSHKMAPSQVGFVMTENPLDRAFVEKLKKLLPDRQVNIYLFDAEGVHLSAGTLETHTLPAIPAAESNATETVEMEDSRYLQRILPLYDRDRLVGAIAVLQTKKTLLDYLFELFDSLLFAIGFTLLVIIPVSILLVRTLTRPIERLQEGIKEIQTGSLGHQIDVSSSDEIAQLTRSFNRMSTDLHEFATAIQERENALKLSQKELEYLSTHDALTDLPNRRLFMLRLEHAIEHAKRRKTKIAVLFLDLDEFKQVNDTLGHDVGDHLLVEVSNRLLDTVRGSDTLARIGGDEFNILIEDVKQIRDVEVVVEKLLVDFKLPFVCGNHELSTTASIGVALYPDDGEDMVTLIKNADLAMYQSKDEGRNNYSFFSKKLSEYIEERTTYINAMKNAMKEEFGEFYLLYQPKICLQTGKISGVEALARWRSPELGLIGPDVFIKIAEETNLIIPLGEWILNRAFKDYKTMHASGCRYPKISINVSSVQLRNSDMIRTVKRALKESGIAPEQVELEITESYVVTDQEKALRTLQELRDMHLDIAIDDFGTGYSSMSYLQKLPVTRLKIDKSFVDELPDSMESTAIAKAIIALANTFGLHITAEGVETQQQLDYLRSIQCHEVQGYYYSKPLSYREFVDFYCTYNKAARQDRPEAR